MVELRPQIRGFRRHVRLGEFIRDFLMGEGPHDSPQIDPTVGSFPGEIHFQYCEAVRRERAKHLAETKKISLLAAERKIRKRSIHISSFHVYFWHLRKLGFIFKTGMETPSTPQQEAPDNPIASRKVFYRISQKGRRAPKASWLDPRGTLYPRKIIS